MLDPADRPMFWFNVVGITLASALLGSFFCLFGNDLLGFMALFFGGDLLWP